MNDRYRRHTTTTNHEPHSAQEPLKTPEREWEQVSDVEVMRAHHNTDKRATQAGPHANIDFQGRALASGRNDEMKSSDCEDPQVIHDFLSLKKRMNEQSSGKKPMFDGNASVASFKRSIPELRIDRLAATLPQSKLIEEHEQDGE